MNKESAKSNSLSNYDGALTVKELAASLKMLEPNQMYKPLFDDCPDVVNVKQMCKMLGGISEKTGYRLLHGGNVKFFTIGRSIRISKMSIIDYLTTAENNGA